MCHLFIWNSLIMTMLYEYFLKCKSKEFDNDENLTFFKIVLSNLHKRLDLKEKATDLMVAV